MTPAIQPIYDEACDARTLTGVAGIGCMDLFRLPAQKLSKNNFKKGVDKVATLCDTLCVIGINSVAITARSQGVKLGTKSMTTNELLNITGLTAAQLDDAEAVTFICREAWKGTGQHALKADEPEALRDVSCILWVWPDVTEQAAQFGMTKCSPPPLMSWDTKSRWYRLGEIYYRFALEGNSGKLDNRRGRWNVSAVQHYVNWHHGYDAAAALFSGFVKTPPYNYKIGVRRAEQDEVRAAVETAIKRTDGYLVGFMRAIFERTWEPDYADRHPLQAMRNGWCDSRHDNATILTNHILKCVAKV